MFSVKSMEENSTTNVDNPSEETSYTTMFHKVCQNARSQIPHILERNEELNKRIKLKDCASHETREDLETICTEAEKILLQQPCIITSSKQALLKDFMSNHLTYCTYTLYKELSKPFQNDKS